MQLNCTQAALYDRVFVFLHLDTTWDPKVFELSVVPFQ